MITPHTPPPDLRRLLTLFGVIVFMFGAIGARLWYLQIVMGADFEEQSASQRTRPIRKMAPRGRITDSSGKEIAISEPHFVVSVLPDELNKYPDTLNQLAAILKHPVEELEAIVDDNRTTSLDPISIAEDVDLTLLSQIEERKLELPGVLIMKDPKRVYKDPRPYAHLLGLVRPITKEMLPGLKDKGYHGGDLTGVFGLEKQYEQDLRGVDGGQIVEVDAKGRIKGRIDEIAPTPGKTLQLTINGQVQSLAYSLLQDELVKGHAGAVVAMDPRDGAVLACVASPSFDLNTYGTDYGKLLKDEKRPLFNRALKAAYPCGSPFKLITAAAGLESGAITRDTTDYCPGFIKYGRRWNCDVRSGHGSVSFERAVGASCNVFFWHTAQKMERETLDKWARNFGIGQKTGIDLPVGEEASGLIPTPQWKTKTKRGPWVGGDLLNMAIGQGAINVTPIQLASYTAALANGGTLMKPQLIRQVVDESGGKPVVIRRLSAIKVHDLGLKQENLRAIQAGMKRVVEEGGTAARIHVTGIELAGKTGTAETYIHGQKAQPHSVFVCYAPADNPQIAIAVLVENGGMGASTAAPIAEKLLAKFFKVDKKEVASRESSSKSRTKKVKIAVVG